MDLTIPVKLKNSPMSFEKYVSTIQHEQSSSLGWMTAPDASWSVAGSLKDKVEESGKLRPFYGDTTVIPNEKDDIEKLVEFQEQIHAEVGELCAEKLLPGHFHITLHDLSNSPSLQEIRQDMKSNEEKCRSIFKETADYLKENPDFSKVRLVSVKAFPCCNISVVLGFAPKTDKDYRIIMNLYNLFDDVVYLSYWLRMHITLAYFKPYEFSKEQMDRLFNVLNNISENRMEVELDLWKLAYQRFDSMNDYKTIFTLEDFR